MAVTNLFKPLSVKTGEMYVFSNYADDLTAQVTEPKNHRVVPSKFAALELQVPEGEDLSQYIGKAFQNYYENSLNFLRSHEYSENEKEYKAYWSNRLFWATLQKYSLINIATYEASTVLNDEPGVTIPPENGTVYNDEETNINYFEGLHYIGDVNIYSTQKQDGINYNEIYCYIPNDAHDTYYNIENPGYSETSTQSYEYEGTQLLGWNDDNYPLNGLPNEAEFDGEGTIEAFNSNWSRPEALCPDDWENYNQDHHNTDKVLDDKEAPMFKVNAIAVFYDVNQIDDEGNIVTIQHNLPMGIYFTGYDSEQNDFCNVVEKYVTHSDIYGQGTSYALRICNRFVSTPNSTIFIDSSTDIYDGLAEFSDIMSQFGETIDDMQDIMSQNELLTRDISEHMAYFKNYRTNVPYIRELMDPKTGNRINYWFVNGRNTGQPAGNYTISDRGIAPVAGQYIHIEELTENDVPVGCSIEGPNIVVQESEELSADYDDGNHAWTLGIPVQARQSYPVRGEYDMRDEYDRMLNDIREITSDAYFMVNMENVHSPFNEDMLSRILRAMNDDINLHINLMYLYENIKDEMYIRLLDLIVPRNIRRVYFMGNFNLEQAENFGVIRTTLGNTPPKNISCTLDIYKGRKYISIYINDYANYAARPVTYIHTPSNNMLGSGNEPDGLPEVENN